MGYKQQNNPFGKATSPLKHMVRNQQGQRWDHSHDYFGRPYTVRGQVIQGNENFGKNPDRVVKNVETGTRRMPEDMGGLKNTERNVAMNYAKQLADAYNQGILTSGQFRADDLYKKGPKISLKNKSVSSPWRGKKIEIKGTTKSLNQPQEFNIGIANQGEVVAPENQFTAEQVYDMMVEGGGMVSIIDGNIVAGNPNEARYDISNIDQRSGNYQNQLKQGVAGGKYEKVYYGEGLDNKTALPEGYEMRGQMPSKTITKYYKWGKEVPHTVRGAQPKRVANPNYEEEMERYRTFGAGFDEKSDSPLNQGHATDERSEQTFNLQEGFDYGEITENVTTSEWVIDPNDPTRMVRTITTDKTITGERKNLNPGGLGQGQAENWAELKEGICNGTIKGDTSICDDVQNISNTVTEYKPIEPEKETDPDPEPDPQPVDFSFRKTSGKSGGKLNINLPKIDLSELIQLPGGLFEPKSARGGRGCGCMVNR